MTDRKILGKRLKKIRLEKGLTQREVADATGISKESIGGYENGKEGAPFERIARLASFYEVSLDQLAGRTGRGGRGRRAGPATLSAGQLVVDMEMVEQVLACDSYDDVAAYTKPAGLVFAFEFPSRCWLPGKDEWEETRLRLEAHIHQLRQQDEGSLPA